MVIGNEGNFPNDSPKIYERRTVLYNIFYCGMNSFMDNQTYSHDDEVLI